MACLSDLDVAALLACELEPGDLRRVVRHLTSGCADCRSRLLAAVPGPFRGAPEPDEGYDAAISGAWRTVRRLLPRLQQDRERIANGVALVTEKGWELTWPELRSFRMVHAEVLLQLSFEQRYRDPGKMLLLARQARKLLDGGDCAARYGEVLFLDLRARAWAELANAYRVNEAFSEAEEALDTARSLLEQGTGDPMLAARIDDLEASLRKAQRRLDEAHRLLDRVYRAYMKIGERHLAGRALMSKGIILEIDRKPGQSIHWHRKAIALLDAARDPQLVATAHHCLLNALVGAGRYAEAGKLLLESGLRRRFAEDPLNLLRLRWVEGKILTGHGRLDDAERVLAEVRSGFLEHELAYVAAVAGLDQAELRLRQGKEVHELAGDILARFQEHDVAPEAVYALMAFEVLCRERAVTENITRRIRSFVEQSEGDSTLRFDLGLVLLA